MVRKRKQLVNIILVTWNEFSHIHKCIKSIEDSTYNNLKIIIVDNHSDKKKYRRFYNKYKSKKNISIFRLQSNMGFSGACNFAIEQIEDGYIVFLNNDTVVTKKWLEPIVNYMQSHKQIGACQPKIKSLRKKSYFEHAGAAGGFMDKYGYPFCRGRIFFDLEKDQGQYDDYTDVVWTSGACMVTHKKVLDKIGMFDTIFFMYGEEADLCWRMNHAGYRLVYVPDSVIYHYGSGTIRKLPHQKVFFHHRNGPILLIKNYQANQLASRLPVRIILDMVTFWYYLLVNQMPQNALSVIKAYLFILYDLPKVIRKRNEVMNHKSNKNNLNYPLYNRSIVLDYYLLKLKKYSQLRFGQR